MDLLSSRVLFVTGKGGVGKSTFVAAAALAAAAAGRRPVTVELGARSSMATHFGVEEVGFSPVAVAEGVHACAICPERALRAFIDERLPGGRWTSRLLTSGGLGSFFRAAPAVSEIATLARIRALRRSYDPVIVDLDATGHAEMLLDVVDVLDELEAGGPLAAFLEEATDLLRGDDTLLHMVTVPSALVVQETTELYTRLARRPTPLGAVVVNRVPAKPWHLPAERLQAMRRRATDASLQADLTLVARAADRERRARAHIDRLAEQIPLPRVELPQLHDRDEIAMPRRLAPLLEGAA